MSITRRRLRLACDLFSFAGPADKRTSQTPKLWLSNDYAIELAFFSGAPSSSTLISDLSTLASLTLELKPLAADGGAPSPATPPLASATVATFNHALTWEDWAQDSGAHAVVTFTATEMSLTKGRAWLVVSLATTGGQVITALAGIVELVEDGYNSAGTAPVLSNAAWTKDEADARYQPIDPDLTAIAALTTTSFGRGLLTQADAAATRGTLGLTSAATGNADGLTTGTVAAARLPTATPSAAGVVPGLGGTTLANAATVGQIVRPDHSELTPYFQVVYRQSATKRGIALGRLYDAFSAVTVASGTIILVPFRGNGMTIGSVSLGSSAAASGLTLARIGIWEVGSWMISQGPGHYTSANSSLVASTAAFTSIGANAFFVLNLSVPLVTSPDKFYFVGLLQVGTTPATLRGTLNGNGFLRLAAPHCSLSIGGLSDLPNDLTGATTTGGGNPLVHTTLSEP